MIMAEVVWVVYIVLQYSISQLTEAVTKIIGAQADFFSRHDLRDALHAFPIWLRHTIVF